MLLSDLSMPMTMSTVPSLSRFGIRSHVDDLELQPEAVSQRRRHVHVDADDFGRGGRLSRQGLVVGVHTDAQLPSLPMVGEDSVGVFSGGV